MSRRRLDGVSMNLLLVMVIEPVDCISQACKLEAGIAVAVESAVWSRSVLVPALTLRQRTHPVVAAKLQFSMRDVLLATTHIVALPKL